MGWWKINNVAKGQIDWSANQGGLANKVPGRDSKNELYNGDGPADIMGEALDKIAQEYKDSWGRYPQKDELLACLNFCSNNRTKKDGTFVPYRDENGKLIEDPELDK